MIGELNYEKLLQDFSTPIYTTDVEGRITMFNKAAAELWGREPAIGEDMRSAFHKILKLDGSEMPLDESPMAVCLREKRAVYGDEILVVRPNGSLCVVVPHPQPLFNSKGELMGAVNMLVDITSIKRVERALRESESKYRQLSASLEKIIEEKTADLKIKNEELKRSEERYHKMVEEVEDYAIILLDKNGIVQNWNRGAEKIKGYQEHEIIGKPFSEFYLTEDRNAGLPEKILNEAKENGKAIYEGWRVRKDGSVFWGSIVLTALHDTDGNIIGFSKVTRDLTQKKLAEDTAQEYTNQLEFNNRKLEQFSYAASHDMKEPLRKILLYLSTVLQKLDGKIDEQSLDYIGRSIKAAKRMSNLLEDLLTYAQTNSTEKKFEEVNLNEIVDEIKLSLKDELDKKIVRIETENLTTITAIRFQIVQLFENLISNAIKYKHPDRDSIITIRGEVVAMSEMPTAELNNSKYYHLSFSDNGIGFEPEQSQKIFEIFQRLHNTSGSKGTGIGLAICKRIVENHHGIITATGIVDEGAQFDIFLPLEGVNVHNS